MSEENNHQEENHVDKEEHHEPEEHKENTENEEKSGKENEGGINAIALLSYLSILFLVPLLAAKEDNFAQYHAKQGLTLFIASVVGMFIGVIPILGWILAPFISLACIILAIIGLVNVVKGEKKELPLIGQYAKKFNV